MENKIQQSSEIVSNGIRGKGEIPSLHKEVQG
jgi:hypothetical protein